MVFRSGMVFATLLVAFCPPTWAQARPAITVAGSGYRNPANSIVAAPGQILLVSVFGVATRIPDPVFPQATNGFPTEVKGISAEFGQGALTVQLQIRGLQQSGCLATGICA